MSTITEQELREFANRMRTDYLTNNKSFAEDVYIARLASLIGQTYRLVEAAVNVHAKDVDTLQRQMNELAKQGLNNNRSRISHLSCDLQITRIIIKFSQSRLADLDNLVRVVTILSVDAAINIIKTNDSGQAAALTKGVTAISGVLEESNYRQYDYFVNLKALMTKIDKERTEKWVANVKGKHPHMLGQQRRPKTTP